MLFDRDSKGDRFSRRHYDSNGNRSGYSRPNLPGGYVNYDRKGRRVGHSEENADGSYDQDLLKQYVQSQHFTSTADIMAAMKEMFRDVIQQVMEVDMDEEPGRERCQRAADPEHVTPNYRNPSNATARWAVARDGSTERNLYFRISENANRIRPVSPYGPFV